MPVLISKNEFIKKNPLKIVFNLLNAENPNDWEGWLGYELKLYQGEDLILSSRDSSTIINSDVEQLIDFLKGGTTGVFEPIEPDFQLFLNPSKKNFIAPQENSTELLFTLDIAAAENIGYSNCGIGVRIIVSNESLLKFSNELESQKLKLTSGLKDVSL